MWKTVPTLGGEEEEEVHDGATLEEDHKTDYGEFGTPEAARKSAPGQDNDDGSQQHRKGQCGIQAVHVLRATAAAHEGVPAEEHQGQAPDLHRVL